MSTKLYTAFLPLLAVAAFAVLPAVAQAQVPHWYSCEKRLGTGEFRDPICTKAAPPKEFEWIRLVESVPVVVKTKGTLELAGITCKVNDGGVAENPLGGGAGVNIVTKVVNTECKGKCPNPEVTALHGGAPLSLINAWPSVLEEKVAGEIRDNISGIELVVLCEVSGKKEVVDVFSGSLTPKVGSSVLEFGAGSGELEDPAKNKARVVGNDEIEGPAGDVGITAKTP